MLSTLMSVSQEKCDDTNGLRINGLGVFTSVPKFNIKNSNAFSNLLKPKTIGRRAPNKQDLKIFHMCAKCRANIVAIPMTTFHGGKPFKTFSVNTDLGILTLPSLEQEITATSTV